MKKRVKKVSLILSPIGIFILASVLWIFLLKLQAIKFLLSQIPKLNSSQNYFDLSLASLEFSLAKLQLKTGQVKVQFKNQLSELQPLQVNEIRFQLDPFKLLVGQFSFSNIQIHQANWNYEFKARQSSEKAFEIPTAEIFKWLPQIPVEQLVIFDSSINTQIQQNETKIQIDIPQINLSHRKNSLNLMARKLQFDIRPPNSNSIKAVVHLNSKLEQLNQITIFDVSEFELQTLESKLSLNAQINHFNQVLIEPKAKLKMKSEIHFEDLRTMVLTFFPQKNRFPAITGFLKSEGDLQVNSLNNINGHFLFETKQVSVDHFKLGQAQVKAEIKKNQIFVNQIELEHPSGTASLKEIEIEQKPPYRFKARLLVKQFDLQKLFVSIGLPEIQAGFKATADSSCEGVATNDFKVTCQIDSDLKDVWLKTDPKASSFLLKLKNAGLKGQLNAHSNGINYKTQLRVGQSIGSSQGEVLFAEGFKLNFETEKLSFNDVETLADLNLKGDLKIKGMTSGDSKAGIIQADAVMTHGEIDRFKIGRLESPLHYEKGQLEFKNLQGLLGKTTYQGHVLFDFNSSTLASNLNLKNLTGEDLLTALNSRFYIPFNLTGLGQAEIQVQGPFDFWKLKYDLKAQLNQGQIADEGFNQLKFNLKADGQKVLLDQVYLKKNKSTLLLDGHISTNSKQPEFSVQIKAQPFYLEESDLLMKWAPQLTGQAWVEGKIKNEILNPELFFNFNIKQMSFENSDYPGSQGQITINKNNFKFAGQLFGRQIQSDLNWPWNENDPFSIRLQIRDLNPLMMLPLIALPQPSSEYYSRLNADIELKSNRRQLNTADGFIRINDFMLQRGALYLKLAKTSQILFKAGLAQMDSILFKGEKNNLRLNLIPSSQRNETRFAIAGDVQLKQFQFLVPFAQGLAGRLQVDSQILFRGPSFELIGDGEITDGLVNLKGFPHAIENINTPIEFSKSKVILSDITAQLGTSEIAGQGQIDIKGHHQINVNLQASAENIELNFPDQITTVGKADIVFFGHWLPYTLKVNYKVARGLVEKNFGEDSKDSPASLKASPYLPPQQIELQAPSLLLDVDIDLSQGVIVKNKLMEGEALGKLHVGGPPENPNMTGRIDIKRGSKLIFKDKAFDIQTATIQFQKSSEINPEIYMTASSRVSDYDINLLVQGPAKNLSIKPSSQPPLSEPDIFSLLALGLTSSKLDQNISSQAQQEQTGLEIIASQVNQSQVNKKFQEKFGLSVQLAPTLDSTKNIAVPKVVVSKKLQKNINASYSRPLTGDTQNQEWKLQYLFNPNKSVILNYQNIETNQQNQLNNPNNEDQGILGLDFEYKKEFK